MELLFDGECFQLFMMELNCGNMVIQANVVYYMDEGIDNYLNVRLGVRVGLYVVGVIFIKKNLVLFESI